MTITTTQYTNLDEAYKYLNDKLFEGKLPECLITLQRRSKNMGYYWHEKFTNREDKSKKISELALNPDTFEEESDIEILSTLVHEMCHVWQHVFGDPPRKGYHDWQFANKMKDVGLQTSSTGEVGGKPVGQKMSDYIIEGGDFEKVAGAFLLNGNKIHWNSLVESKEQKAKNKTREKFVCKTCMQQIWAKKTANIICGDCLEKMVIEDE